MSVPTPSGVLLAAQQQSLTHDERIATMSLRSLKRGVPTLPIEDVLVRAEVTLTLDGASTVELDVLDPNWLIERSGVLDPDTNGILNAVAISIDSIPFRLSDARRAPGSPTITLEFEDLAMALLDEHDSFKAFSRGTKTRAQFVKWMVDEVKTRDLAFWSPDAVTAQPVAKPDLPSTAPKQGETGFDKGATFKVKGVVADPSQMANAATVLGVCDDEGMSDRLRITILCAAIGESTLRDIPNSQGSPYGGVLGGRKDRHLSTTEQARSFLKGGNGFQGGGAIALARSHPEWSAGHIAYVVEGDLSNFGGVASTAEYFYQQHHDEAKAIVDLWNGANTGGSRTVQRFKEYRYTRGLPGQKETSRKAAQRLAEEVNWRFYAIGGMVVFNSDEQMIAGRAGLSLTPTVQDDGTMLVDGLLSMPGYEWGHGKLPAQVEMQAIANAWSVFPGEVVLLHDMGPLTGRWLVETFRFDLLNATVANVQMIKPLPSRKEPAPDAITVDVGTDSAKAGASSAVKWAVSRLGHYAEEFGNNRGQELDALEQRFGLQGAPWCAIFATTALVHAGVQRDCRTAAVKDINDWCVAGTHGYMRGYRGTPKPGDLMVFGNDHVALVEKVANDGIHTIEGNSSAGEVARLIRAPSSGKFVRPVYPS